MADEAELFKPGTGASKIRIIVQSDDYNLFDGTQLLARVQKLNDEAGGKIIKGVPELVRFDPEKSGLIADLNLSEYKTIFVAGWKPKETKQSFDNLNFFQPYLHAYDGDRRNFFNWYGTTFKHENAVLVLLVCLKNVFDDAELLEETLDYKLQNQVSNDLNGYDSWYGNVALAYATAPSTEPVVFKVQDEKKISYSGGFTAWLEKPLSQKSVVEKLEKTEQERLKREGKKSKEDMEKWEKQWAEKKLEEEQKKLEWENLWAKAKEFTYKKEPKVRLITQPGKMTDALVSVGKVKDFLVGQGIKADRFVPVVSYDSGTPMPDLLDGEYKNIFVFSWNFYESQQSTLFFREVYFSSYGQAKADLFSPVTSLVLFVPQNDEAKQKILGSGYVGTLWGRCQDPDLTYNSCGGKPVAVGYLVPDGAQNKIFGLEGVNTLVDWLKYGVK